MPPVSIHELGYRLSAQSATPAQHEQIARLRDKALEFGAALLDVPEGRNKSRALTHLEDALSRAIRAVTHDPPDESGALSQ